jgi:hypothetical protein
MKKLIFLAIAFLLIQCSGSSSDAPNQESATEIREQKSEHAEINNEVAQQSDSLQQEETEASSKTVYITHDGNKYHTADCRYAKSGHAVKLNQAKAEGKTACDLCKPNAKTGVKQIRCSAKTKEGKQCQRMTTDGSGKCFQHKG